MRLVSAKIKGAGKLVDSTIKLDQKVVAIVGPNEAGKTTLLEALSYVDRGGVWDVSKRSRAGGAPVDDATAVVTLRYLLDETDREALADIGLHEAPREYRVTRRAGGGVVHHVIPRPRNAETEVTALAERLAKTAAGMSELLPVDDVDDAERERLAQVAPEVLTSLTNLGAEIRDYLAQDSGARTGVAALREAADEMLETVAGYAGLAEITSAIEGFLAWCDRPDPAPELGQRLWKRSPDIVLFDEDARSLSSTYPLSPELAADPPAALRNLAQYADLDLRKLAIAQATGQTSLRDTLKNLANKRLKEKFSVAWQQSQLAVQLNVEQDLLRVNILEDEVFSSVLDERSAGLRMFVALTTFVASRPDERGVIVLIDEAENHLHINAQADLVRMLGDQDVAEKVIYTTHSPACLPEDLGCGIRVVVPDGEEVSHVENQFWREAPGFSPLMFAMGAGAAAFTPARYAVIAEGATEMILFPSLVRQATDLARVPYQVAPGLSEAPRALYPSLDLEAARVAYLVDGDDGGDQLEGLLRRDVPSGLIVKLGSPGIENVLDAAVYRSAFVAGVEELNPDAHIPDPPTLDEPAAASWATVLEQWADRCGLRRPTKGAVASHLVANGFAMSEWGKQVVAAAHAELMAALRLAT